MGLTHHKWEKCGRIFRHDDDPTRFVYKSRVGQLNVLDNGEFFPYKWDSATKTLSFGNGRIVLAQSGIEFHDNEKKIFTGTFNPESKKGAKYQKDPDITIGGLTVEPITYADKPIEEVKISYSVQSAGQKVDINITTGSCRRVTFGYKVTNRSAVSLQSRIGFDTDIAEQGEDVIAKIRDRHGTIISQPIVGRKFDGHSFRWEKEEEQDHRVEFKPTFAIGIMEKTYSPGEVRSLTPTSWGPTAEADDGYDYDGTLFYSDVAGDIRVGQQSSGSAEPVNAGMTWQNVTASGTANDGCTITLYNASRKKTPSADIRVVDTRDNAAWSSSNLPVNATFHAGTVDWTNIGDAATDTSPELKTLIQARFDDDHVSGDEIAICVLRDAANPAYAYADWSATEGGSPAALTIDYTAGGGGRTRRLMISMNAIMSLGFLFSLINNPKLTKRQLLNPLNWLKK